MPSFALAARVCFTASPRISLPRSGRSGMPFLAGRPAQTSTVAGGTHSNNVPQGGHAPAHSPESTNRGPIALDHTNGLPVRRLP